MFFNKLCRGQQGRRKTWSVFHQGREENTRDRKSLKTLVREVTKERMLVNLYNNVTASHMVGKVDSHVTTLKPKKFIVGF